MYTNIFIYIYIDYIICVTYLYYLLLGYLYYYAVDAVRKENDQFVLNVRLDSSE